MNKERIWIRSSQTEYARITLKLGAEQIFDGRKRLDCFPWSGSILFADVVSPVLLGMQWSLVVRLLVKMFWMHSDCVWVCHGTAWGWQLKFRWLFEMLISSIALVIFVQLLWQCWNSIAHSRHSFLETRGSFSFQLHARSVRVKVDKTVKIKSKL